MELSHDEVLEILALIERSEVAYLELQVGDTRIVADRDGTGGSSRAPAEASGAAPQPADVNAVAAPPAAAPPAPTPTTPAPSEPGAASATPGESGAGHGGAGDDVVEVTAPVVGVFYRAPEPGAPPFVEAGSPVQAGDTLGLVEVMKMFNSVTADQAGVVVDILADNEQFVEFNEPLMTIRPEGRA